MHQKHIYHQNPTWNRCNSEYNPKTTNNLMVSFQFRQGINAKSLARHGNGAIKHFSSEFKQNRTSKIKTLTYFKHKFKSKSKREISRLFMNENHYYHIRTLNPINGCCFKLIQSIKWDAQASKWIQNAKPTMGAAKCA